MILKVRAMVSDKFFQNPEQGNNLVEYEVRGCLTVGFNCRHSLSPFREVINSHYDMMMHPAEARLQSIKSSPHLVKGSTVMMGCNGASLERILLVNTWQGWHLLTASTQSLKIDGQK